MSLGIPTITKSVPAIILGVPAITVGVSASRTLDDIVTVYKSYVVYIEENSYYTH